MHHHKLRGKEPDGCGAGAADHPQLEATSPESGEGSLCHHQHGPRQVKGSGGACRWTALLTGTTASPSDEEEEGTAPGSVCGLRPCSPKNTVLHLGVDGLCQTTGSPCSPGSSCSRLARSSFPHTWVPPGRPRPSLPTHRALWPTARSRALPGKERGVPGAAFAARQPRRWARLALDRGPGLSLRLSPPPALSEAWQRAQRWD